MKKVLLIFLLLFVAAFVNAQEEAEEHSSAVEFSAGVDFVSSFLWRGLNLGNSPAIQPNAAISAFGFELSAFGSYALVANEYHGFSQVPYTEFDLELKYSLPTSAGTFSIVATDIFMPHLGLEYSNYDGIVDDEETGAHWLCAGITYEGPEHFPLSLKLDYNFYNEISKSIYAELGYNFTCGGTSIDLFCGAAMGTNKDVVPGSIFYEIEKDEIGIINVGGTITKTIEVTNTFSIPLSTSVIFNPNANAAYLVFSLSL
jgi:hypothetical protein